MKSPIGSAVFRVLLIIGTVATLYLGYVNAFDPVNRFIPLLGVITTSVTAILGLPEAWDRFGPTKSTHKRPAKPVNEATYLNGRLEIFAKEDKWFMPLAGDTVVESGLDAFKDAFSQQTVGVRKKEYAKVSSAARDYRQFVIVGEPGAGKTTVLKHLALAVIRSRLNPDIETESLMATLYDGLRVPLPLWIDLGNSANPPDAEALLHYWWNQVYALKGSVESGLNNLDVWLFLDGLNEMPEQGVGWRKRARSLRAWLKKYPDVRVIFTCRIHDYDKQLNLGLPVVHIRPLKENEIEAFVRKRLEDDADAFLAGLKERPKLRAMATNPYTLAMLLDIHLERAELPADLNKLYEIQMRLRYQDYAKRGLMRLPWLRLQKRLQHLAFRMIVKGKGTATDERWAQRAVGRRVLHQGIELGALVVDESTGAFRFYHQSLHQYFALPRLLDHFEDISTRRRRRFIRQIRDLGQGAEPALPILLRTLKDPDEDIRTAAAQSLGSIGDPVAVPHLIEALRDPNQFVRIQAMQSLGSIGDPTAVPPLIKILPHRVDGGWAEQSLKSISDPAAIPYVVAALSDPGIRLTATKILEHIGDATAVPHLVEILGDPDEEIRAAAVKSLGSIGDPTAVPPLIKALNDADTFVRASAAQSLGSIGDPVAVPALIKALHDAALFVRMNAVDVLNELGDPTAVPPLIEALNNPNPDTRAAAAKLLGSIGDPAAVSKLEAVLNDPKIFVRWCAEEALGHFRPLTERHRPAFGGVSIGHYQSNAGSFGCLVRDRTDLNTVYILSIGHVIAPDTAKKGDPILQPGPADGGDEEIDVIATLERWLELDPESDNNLYAAIAKVNDPELILPEIPEVGRLTGVADAKAGMVVMKVGRTTGLTFGRISAINAGVTMAFNDNRKCEFRNVLICDSMAHGGDDGALLIDMEKRAVGLLLAGTEKTPTVCLPIQRVLDDLGVTLITD